MLLNHCVIIKVKLGNFIDYDLVDCREPIKPPEDIEPSNPNILGLENIIGLNHIQQVAELIAQVNCSVEVESAMNGVDLILKQEPTAVTPETTVIPDTISINSDDEELPPLVPKKKKQRIEESRR